MRGIEVLNEHIGHVCLGRQRRQELGNGIETSGRGPDRNNRDGHEGACELSENSCWEGVTGWAATKRAALYTPRGAHVPMVHWRHARKSRPPPLRDDR